MGIKEKFLINFKNKNHNLRDEINSMLVLKCTALPFTGSRCGSYVTGAFIAKTWCKTGVEEIKWG